MVETTSTIKKVKEYKKVCPYCGTGIISMYPKQLDFNFNIHQDNCEYNPKNMEKKQ